jgi:N6-L-threonylcarbamoyladenine synthase
LGALLVGVSFAKAAAFSLNKPLIKVNHIEAHIAANYLQFPDLEPPFLSLVVSGGHTSIIDVKGYNDFELIGGTEDDAIGEAFDKTARILGLPYPGGPNIDKLSKFGIADTQFYKTPKTVRKDLSLSYSGLKTAVVNYVHNLRQKGAEIPVEDICASFTKCAVDLLIDTALYAARSRGQKRLVLAGGVASNSYLRENLTLKAENEDAEVFFPAPRLCTDNAAMVAARGYYSLKEGKNLSGLRLNADGNLRMYKRGNGNKNER